MVGLNETVWMLFVVESLFLFSMALGNVVMHCMLAR